MPDTALPDNPAPERPIASIPQSAAEAAALPDIPEPADGRFDVLVVGGGPAGLSCGIWLGRYLHSVALVDSGDPRNWETRGVNGFLGQPHVQPCELRESGRDECRKYGVTMVDACVDRVTKHDDEHFELTLQDGRTLHGRRLFIGIGIKDVWPDVPGLGRVYGNRAHVCPDCDGYEARGRKTVVIGNGRKAVGMALDLANWTRDIIVCTNGDPPDFDDALRAKLDGLGIETVLDRIERIHFREGDLRSLEFARRPALGCEKIFFAIAQYPADDLGVQLGCERDEEGRIVVDRAQHTSVWNVFAAGDITAGPQLAIRAAADGAVAALAIHKSLLPAERQMPPRAAG
ncbi:MAG TPA: FAD-dependent oxidoreductase [Gemmatimonadaceae bacterium]|nr:FAD-dependent oxidoreductase [Gemmatimonadaceae bacterium]